MFGKVRVSSLHEELLSPVERVELSYINHLQVVFYATNDFSSMARLQVEVDD